MFKKVKNKQKNNILLDQIIFLIALFAVSVITYMLFYRQTSTTNGMFHSDMKAYILEMQGLNTKYNFPYPIFFKFSALLHLLFSPEIAVALATTI